MPQISPFSGLLFDQARVGPLERVTAPPYDTISAEDQYGFREASPYNIVRLDLGEQHHGDDDVTAKYRRAASELRRYDAVAAFLLPETSAERIRAEIERGRLLPRKSTYFWPKPRTGLVIRPPE